MTIITAATAEHNKNTGAIVPKQENMNDATSQKETIAISQRVRGGIFLQVLCGAAGKPHLTHSVSLSVEVKTGSVLICFFLRRLFCEV